MKTDEDLNKLLKTLLKYDFNHKTGEQRFKPPNLEAFCVHLTCNAIERFVKSAPKNLKLSLNLLLCWAAIFDNICIVELLVKYGADVNAKYINGFSPLVCAGLSKVDSLEKAKFLIRNGANVFFRTNEGHSTLWITHPKVICILLKQGVNPNARSNDNNTPLHFLALIDDWCDAAEILLKAGADIHAVNNAGETPLSIAEKYSPAILELFSKYSHAAKVRNENKDNQELAK